MLVHIDPGVGRTQARQRSGRAGRETSGTCYRLYTEEGFRALAVSKSVACGMNDCAGERLRAWEGRVALTPPVGMLL